MGLWAGSCSSHPPAWQHPQPAGKVLGEAWRTLQLQGKCRSWVHRVQRDPAEGMDQGKPKQQHISVAIWGSEPFRGEKKEEKKQNQGVGLANSASPADPVKWRGHRASPCPACSPEGSAPVLQLQKQGKDPHTPQASAMGCQLCSHRESSPTLGSCCAPPVPEQGKTCPGSVKPQTKAWKGAVDPSPALISNSIHLVPASCLCSEPRNLHFSKTSLPKRHPDFTGRF